MKCLLRKFTAENKLTKLHKKHKSPNVLRRFETVSKNEKKTHAEYTVEFGIDNFRRSRKLLDIKKCNRHLIKGINT